MMKRAILSLLSVAAVVASCTKSQTELPPSAPISKSMTVEKAKTIVDRTILLTKSSHGEDSTIMPRSYIPQWGDAREETNKVLEAVEIPIITNKNLFAVDRSGRKLTVHQRVLVADGQNFRHASSYMMTLIADADYNGDLWSVEHAGNRQGFTGVILYHALSTGQFVKVKRLNNGESVNQLYVSKYSDENVELLKSEIVRIMCGVRLFQSSFETKSGDDPIDGGSIGEVVIIGDRGNGGHGGSGGLGGGLGKDDTSGNNTNEDDQQCPDLGGGGGGWTPPIPQGPPPMTLQKAQRTFDEILSQGKIKISDITDNITSASIRDVYIKINGRNIYVYYFGVGFGGNEVVNNYLTSNIDFGKQSTSVYSDGVTRWMFDMKNQNNKSVGSLTVGIGDRDFIYQTFANAPRP